MLASAYDLNGNMTAQTVNGQMTRFTWDDEGRLASTTLPDGHTDGKTYTGLGMRLSKTDGGVGYAYLCDGVSPASLVLSDGLLSFTPGISQTLGTPNGSGGMSYASHFYAEDAVGNLRGMSDGGAQGFPDAYNWDAFGQLIGRAGGTSTPFGYGEASGYQTDGDSGLRLLGHRYYDSRTGRFISQDPAGAGDNWYIYCGNDPVKNADPTGLQLEGGGPSPFEQMAAGGASTLQRNQGFLNEYDLDEKIAAQHRVIDLVLSNGKLFLAATGDDSISATVREAIRRSVEDPKGACKELQDLLEDDSAGTYAKSTTRVIKDGQKAIQRNYKLSDHTSQFRLGKVTRVFPKYSELQNMTVKDVLKRAWPKADAQTVSKLVFDGRFAK